MQLPDLVQSRDEFWKWLKSFWDWLQHFFHFHGWHPSIDPRVLTVFLIVFLGIPLAAYIGYLVYVGITAWIKRDTVSPSWRPPVLNNDLDATEQGLREALGRQDYAAALRWRWRLFLVRRAFEPGLTPFEWKDTQPVAPELVYDMFGDGRVGVLEFKRYDDLMGSYERR